MTALEAKEQSDTQFEAAGFVWADWNKWTYTLPGDFPTFSLAPGTLGAGTGLVATGPDHLKVLFAYETPPADIANQLAGISATMRCDAEMAEAELVDQPVVDDYDDWIDIDDFMGGLWVRS